MDIETKDLIKFLTNVRSLRVFARDMEVSILEDMLSKLTSVVDERRESIEAEKAANAERLEKLKIYKKMLEDDGVSLDDLMSLTLEQPAKKRTRTPRAPKYEYRDDNGNMKTWTGQGRMPTPIAKAVEAGKELDSFLINPLA